MSFRRPAAAFLAALLVTTSAHAATPDAQARGGEGEFRDLYKELVETDSSWPNGSCTVAAERMAARLKAGGYADADMEIVVDPAIPRKAI